MSARNGTNRHPRARATSEGMRDDWAAVEKRLTDGAQELRVAFTSAGTVVVEVDTGWVGRVCGVNVAIAAPRVLGLRLGSNIRLPHGGGRGPTGCHIGDP